MIKITMVQYIIVYWLLAGVLVGAIVSLFLSGRPKSNNGGENE